MNDSLIEDVFSKWHRAIWHIAFWTFFISFFALVYGSFEEDYERQFLILSTEAIIQAPAVYFVLYLLMPRLLFKGKYIAFSVSLIIIILIFSFSLWVFFVKVQHPLFSNDHVEYAVFNFAKILKYTTKIYPVLVLAIIIKWAKYWYFQQKATQHLAKEKLTAELNFLKAQVHPHFLFNTLNNLYALTLRQSKEAPEVVLKLSALLDHMLYECNSDEVLLEKEISVVKDYISLQKIRYGDRLHLTFNITGDIEGKSISPLMILPFIENSFKHGVSEELNESWISIDLEVKPNGFILKVENSKSKEENATDHFHAKKGIGLTNVRRRLELVYAENHELSTHDSSDSFLVILNINLPNDD